MPDFLSAQELLSGSRLTHDIRVPESVLHPNAESAAPGSAAGNGHAPAIVRMRPLTVATLTLIARAARDDEGLTPLLIVKESLVEPVLTLDQIRQLHAGLIHFLVSRAYRISGLTDSGDAIEAADSPSGAAYTLLARHFGWTPDQVSDLTPGQVAVYLAGIERLLSLEGERR
jgi:hypothetical protein